MFRGGGGYLPEPQLATSCTAPIPLHSHTPRPGLRLQLAMSPEELSGVEQEDALTVHMDLDVPFERNRPMG